MNSRNERKNYILNLKEISGTSLKIARRMYEHEMKETISDNTIKNVWRENGHPINSHGGSRKLTPEQFSKVYTFSKGDFNLMKNILEVEDSKLVKYCNKYNQRPENMPVEKKFNTNNSSMGKQYLFRYGRKKYTGKKSHQY